MDGKDKFGTYRYAMALIKGEFKKEGANEQDIRSGFNILKQIADNVHNNIISVSISYDRIRITV